MIYVPFTRNKYSLNISNGPVNLNRIGISEAFKKSASEHDHLATISMPKMSSALSRHAAKSAALQSNCDTQQKLRVYLRRGR